MSKSLDIFWTDDAQRDFHAVINFYKSKSNQAHKLVSNALMKTLSKAAANPLIFEADNLKSFRNENFITFTIYHTRVTYEVRSEKLFVLRLRHTSREPHKY